MAVSTIDSNSLNATSDLTINGVTVGKGTNSVSNNTAVGASALAGANSGTGNNTAVGYQASYSNTTGYANVSIGYQAGKAITTGVGNVCMGYLAGYTNISSNNTTYIGNQAGANATGEYNTCIGFASGSSITTGTKNTILGGYNGNQSFLDMRTLSNYVVLSDGDGNARQIIDSSGKILFGATGAANTSYNRITIWEVANTQTGIYMQKNGQVEVQMGFKASTNTDFYIGTGSTTMGTYGVYLANTGNSWISVSDERQKDIIEPIENALTKVNAIRAVIGKYKHDANDVRRSFLIAQDVQAVFPEAVKAQDDEEALLGLSYTDVIPLLVASIKELKTIVDAQAAEIAELKAKVA
jgi:hypothetical protein